MASHDYSAIWLIVACMFGSHICGVLAQLSVFREYISANQASAQEFESPCHQACTAISSRHPESVFIGRTGDFEFWDAKQAEVTPACRVEPNSADELSWTLQEIIRHQCHFAVKSGGHDRTPGASNAEGGITIDLVRFNSIELAEDKKSVKIGAGLRWVDVYRALEKHQLMALGGRISDVGVGGLLLGGGISFFSNERGLACDSIISHEIVLPNGSIITTTATSHPDLFKALRGAGAANFGIVTSFTLEIFPIKHNGIWTGHRLVAWDRTPDLLRANHKLVTEIMEKDLYVSAINIFGCQPSHDICFGIVQDQHTMHDNPDTWPESFQNHESIVGFEHTMVTGIEPVSNLTEKLAGTLPPGTHRTIYGTFTYSPSIELEIEILAIYREIVDTVKDIAGLSPCIIMHPFSTNMISKMQKNGGNSLGSIANHKGPLIIFNVSWQWENKADDERAYASYHQLMARIEEAAGMLDVWHPYKYINYAEASQDVFEGYGHESLGRLRRLQKEMDPDGVFARGGLAGGSFKLNTLNVDSRPSAPGSTVFRDRSEL